jgi:hypothetical protein
MKTWDDVKAQVEKNGNVWTTTMDELREANGSGKLGTWVREEISSRLAGVGLGHIPPELPTYSSNQVRLYKRGTIVGDLLEKILTPGAQNDTLIIDKLSGKEKDLASVVAKIRELVAE